MSEIIIRDCDKKEIKEFRTAAWKRFNDEKGYSIKETEHFLSAEKDEIIVGFSQYYLNGGVGYLDQLIVAREERGKGIGKSLLSRFEEICKKKGCHKLKLETCPAFHPNAYNMYKKRGYKIEAKLKNDRLKKEWVIMAKKI